MSSLFTRPPSNTSLRTVTFWAKTQRFAPLVNRMFWIVEFGVVTVTSWLTTVSGTDSSAPVVMAFGKLDVGAGGELTGWQATASNAPTTGSASRMRAPRAGASAVGKRDTGILLGGWAGPLAAPRPRRPVRATAPVATGTAPARAMSRGARGRAWGEGRHGMAAAA